MSMHYSIQQLAGMSGVSVRTLHYYDEIGLLRANRNPNNGYRIYSENDVLRLQQILCYRALEMPLEEIEKVLQAKDFSLLESLYKQKMLLEKKQGNLKKIVRTIEKTIERIEQKNSMNDEELFEGLDRETMAAYEAEAKERWGNTDAYQQSQENMKKMGKEGLQKVMEEGKGILMELVAVMDHDVAHEDVQKNVHKHFMHLHNFYTPSWELYRGLAQMYVQDSRFTEFYEKVAPGLAKFLSDAMMRYCDVQENN